MANPKHVEIVRQGPEAIKAWRIKYPDEPLDLTAASFLGAYLRDADLHGADLEGVRLPRANLQGADLRDADLERADLHEADLRGVRLQGALLHEANLEGADLRGAHLQGALLHEADLRGVRLHGADLRGAHLQGASLFQAILDGATITDACLWETQRAGWSIQGVICEAVYWDQDQNERTLYASDEFERLHADKTKIVLQYEGGIQLIEIATLPALIQQLETRYQGCALRLSSVEEAPGGAAKVTLVVEKFGGRTPAELTAVLQEHAKQLQAAQRYALEQVDLRHNVERHLAQLKDKVFTLLLEQATQQPRLVPPQESYLTVLFLDMRGFSGLEEGDRTAKVALLRGLAQPLLDQHGGQYTNTWGDAITACFDKANAGLTCACQLVTVLQGVGIRTRIGMSRGKTLVRYNLLTARLDIEGEAVNFAARLEPLAEPGEVLISEELRYHPEVDPALFSFTRQSRPLKKSVGDQPKGAMIVCYTTTLVETTK